MHSTAAAIPAAISTTEPASLAAAESAAEPTSATAAESAAEPTSVSAAESAAEPAAQPAACPSAELLRRHRLGVGVRGGGERRLPCGRCGHDRVLPCNLPGGVPLFGCVRASQPSAA